MNEKAPRAPTGLSKNAKYWWRRVVPRLVEMEVVDIQADHGRLVLLAQAWGMAMDAYQTIMDEGLFRKDENKVTRKHPAHQVWRDSVSMYNSLGKELGLTPLSRNRLGVKPDAGADELIAFLTRGRKR